MGQGRQQRRVEVLRQRLDDQKQRLRRVVGDVVPGMIDFVLRGCTRNHVPALADVLPPNNDAGAVHGVAIASSDGAVYLVDSPLLVHESPGVLGNGC